MAKKSPKFGGWLFKEDPGCFTYANLEKDGFTMWTGVQNALARQHLRKVKAGDRVLYYHTGSERAIVGEMLALTDATGDSTGEDPKAVTLKVEPVKRWEPPVKLEEIKQDPLFAEWELVRNSRLSVVPVSPERWQRLEQMRDKNALSKVGA